jgi:hypothetical protein
MDYLPKKHSDLEIQLYFEPDTLRHVMTVYLLTISPQMAHSEIDTARQQESRYRLEERFADFKSVDDLTLPGRWTRSVYYRFVDNGISRRRRPPQWREGRDRSRN